MIDTNNREYLEPSIIKFGRLYYEDLTSEQIKRIAQIMQIDKTRNYRALIKDYFINYELGSSATHKLFHLHLSKQGSIPYRLGDAQLLFSLPFFSFCSSRILWPPMKFSSIEEARFYLENGVYFYKNKQKIQHLLYPMISNLMYHYGSAAKSEKAQYRQLLVATLAQIKNSVDLNQDSTYLARILEDSVILSQDTQWATEIFPIILDFIEKFAPLDTDRRISEGVAQGLIFIEDLTAEQKQEAQRNIIPVLKKIIHLWSDAFCFDNHRLASFDEDILEQPTYVDCILKAHLELSSQLSAEHLQKVSFYLLPRASAQMQKEVVSTIAQPQNMLVILKSRLYPNFIDIDYDALIDILNTRVQRQNLAQGLEHCGGSINHKRKKI